MTFNLSSRCSTRTSVQPFPRCLADLENTRLRSVRQTGMACSSSSLIISEKGTFLILAPSFLDTSLAARLIYESSAHNWPLIQGRNGFAWLFSGTPPLLPIFLPHSFYFVRFSLTSVILDFDFSPFFISGLL